MQAFEYKDNDRHIGILHQPKTGKQIKDEQLIKLINIIKSKKDIRSNDYLSKDDIIMFNSLTIQNNEIIFTKNISEDQLGNICYFLQKTFGEKIIVPQIMGSGPAIRHRPLFFEADYENKNITVKFTTFGDFNNFNNALSILSNI